jgi:hypothetical protein
MGNLDRWMRAKFTRSTQINAQAAKRRQAGRRQQQRLVAFEDFL